MLQAITSCTLDREQAAYVISVETPVPLHLVLLYSHLHMDLLDSSDDEEKGQVHVSTVVCTCARGCIQ